MWEKGKEGLRGIKEGSEVWGLLLIRALKRGGRNVGEGGAELSRRPGAGEQVLAAQS